ncbi:MAG: 6-phosphogluconolactonase [Myxococcota bacterium]
MLDASSGGTARPVYEALAQRDIDWSQVNLTFSDERAVPPDDASSNYAMARAALIDHIDIPAEQVWRLPGEADDLDAAALAFEATLPRSVDIVLLGIGTDGHTASLFPDSPALGEHVRHVVPVQGPPPHTQRLTMTPPALMSAQQVAVLAHGRGKANILSRAMLGPFDPRSIPASLARSGLWLLDTEAAMRLPRSLLRVATL